jgi:hypothetical protein
MNSSSKPRLARRLPSDNELKTRADSIDTLATTINCAIEQAEQLGISSAVQLLMMARLEVDLTEIALTTRARDTAA